MRKVENVGFVGVEVLERRPLGLKEIALYPNFQPDFLEFLARVLPEGRHGNVVYAMILLARKVDSFT